MGIAATGSQRLASEVGKATAQEISAVGVNLILGPVLDVLTNARTQPLGVRSMGDDPQEVSKYGVSYIKGYKEAGIATCGKHFPSYGNLEFLAAGGSSGIPVITDTLEQLSLSAMIPFRNAIASGLDAMMVGGCALVGSGSQVMHACLSEEVVEELLRNDMGFGGVVLSACLRMEALIENIGVGGGTVMAVRAGCDIVVLCRTLEVQEEAIAGLKLAVKDGMVSKDRIQKSLRRVLEMKSKCTSWEQALNPPGISYLSTLQPSHRTLSRIAYQNSISVVRDKNHYLPISNIIDKSESLLLLTPLVNPLPASVTGRTLSESMPASPSDSVLEDGQSLMSGEDMFRRLGNALVRRRNGKVLHASYTANGVQLLHENLINRASAVIVLTADANRNHYQVAFTKHVAMICNSRISTRFEKRKTPLLVVSVSSPYDFAIDQSIGTYICTYDFTEAAMDALVGVLYGDFPPRGALPGTVNRHQKAPKTRQYWLVEDWLEDRDRHALDVLIKAVVDVMPPHRRSPLTGSTYDLFCLRNSGAEESHFVVRNSTTQELYGFCSTYFFTESATGVIGALFVSPTRRNLSIGNSLHERAKRSLLNRPGIRTLQIGSVLPSIFLGIPADDISERKRLSKWFADRGWNTSSPELVYSMVIRNLSSWVPPFGLAEAVQLAGVGYDTVTTGSYANAILEHVKENSSHNEVELYKVALADPRAYQIVRARRIRDGAMLGCMILCDSRTSLAEYIPAIRSATDGGAGILTPIIELAIKDHTTVLQGLIIHGIRMLKAQGLSGCLLDKVSKFSSDDMGVGKVSRLEADEHCCRLTTMRTSMPHLRSGSIYYIVSRDGIGYYPR